MSLTPEEKNLLRKLGQRVSAVEKGLRRATRTASMAYSSQEGGSLEVYDDDGTVRTVIGVQPDGSFTVADVNGPPPPKPAAPVVEAGPGSVSVVTDGATADGSLWPGDLAAIVVHLGTAADFIPDAATEQHRIASAAGGSVTLAATAGVPVWVRLVAVNTSGVTSPATAAVEATPGAVVTSDELADLVAGYEVEYAVGASATVAPVDGWSTTAPTRTPGTYIWTRTTVTRQDGSQAQTSPVLVTGNDGQPGDQGDPGTPGDPGAPGDTGVSVTAITPYYARVATGATAPTKPTTLTPAAPWVSTEPTLAAATELYTTARVTFSDTTFGYTTVSKSAAYAAAVAAQAAASNAVTVAAGKANPPIFSASTPGSTPNTAGDQWFQTASGVVLSQWQGNGGTSWTERKVSGTALAADAIDGRIITGSTLRTAATGERVVVRNDGSGGVIEAFTGVPNEAQPGELNPYDAGNLPGVVLRSGRLHAPGSPGTLVGLRAALTLNSGATLSGTVYPSEAFVDAESIYLGGGYDLAQPGLLITGPAVHLRGDSNTPLRLGGASHRTTVVGLLDATVQDGGVGNGTFRDAVDARADTRVSASRFYQKEVNGTRVTNITTTPTNVADLVITFNSPGPTAVYEALAILDFQNTVTGSAAAVGDLTIDGVAQTPAAILTSPAAPFRTTAAQNWDITGLAAGSHTLRIRVWKNINNATWQLMEAHSSLRLLRVA